MRRFLSDAIATNPAAPVAAVLGLIGLAYAVQLSMPLNHDVSWLLLATGRLLDGADVFLDDVIEVNPPLILYLFTPVVVLGRLFELSEISVVRIYVTLWILGSLFLSSRLLSRSLGTSSPWLRGTFLVAIAYVISIVEYEFGQREHLMLLLLVPYLLALAVRGRGEELRLGEALWVGLAGGLAISLKPHYLLALAALELCLAIRLRSARSLRRPEFLVLGAVGVTYLASILVATPAYLDFVLPLARDTYWAYQNSWNLYRPADLWFAGFALLGFLTLFKQPERQLAEVLLTAAAGFYVAYVVQATGYPYQLIPFRAAAILLIALALASLCQRFAGPRIAGWIADENRGPRTVRRTVGAGLCALILPALVLCVEPNALAQIRNGGDWRAGGTQGVTLATLRLIDRYAPGAPFYFLSIYMIPAFPMLSYTETDWPSRFSHLWILPAIIRARAGDPLVPAHLDRERIRELEKYLRDAVAEDLERNPPKLILVDRSLTHRTLGGQQVNLLKWFQKDPRFQAIWSRYETVDETGRWLVGRRIRTSAR